MFQHAPINLASCSAQYFSSLLLLIKRHATEKYAILNISGFLAANVATLAQKALC